MACLSMYILIWGNVCHPLSVSLSVGKRKSSLPINGDVAGSSAYDDVVLPRRGFLHSSHFQPPVIPQAQGNRRGRTGSDVVLEANSDISQQL